VIEVALKVDRGRRGQMCTERVSEMAQESRMAISGRLHSTESATSVSNAATSKPIAHRVVRVGLTAGLLVNLCSL
jgi:hypothetical protein